MRTLDREPRSPASAGRCREMNERRIDPGTVRRENIDRPSKLSPAINGKSNAGSERRIPVKR